ncbi:hypothetical protein ACFWE6_36575, partial [Streptomyces nigra]
HFYDAPTESVRIRWGEVRELVRGGDRIIVTVRGRDGLALVPLTDLGTDHAHLPTTSVTELFGGLGAAAEQVKDKERRVATFHGRDVLGVMPAAEWLAAHPGARRVPLPPPGPSADGTGTKEITATALWKDNGPLLQPVAENDARYRVTRLGEPDLGVISEAAFQTYVSQEQPEPIHRWAGNHPSNLPEIYDGLARGVRYLITSGSYKAVLVPAADLKYVGLQLEWASLMAPALVDVGAPTGGVGGSGVLPEGVGVGGSGLGGSGRVADAPAAWPGSAAPGVSQWAGSEYLLTAWSGSGGGLGIPAGPPADPSGFFTGGNPAASFTPPSQAGAFSPAGSPSLAGAFSLGGSGRVADAPAAWPGSAAPGVSQ